MFGLAARKPGPDLAEAQELDVRVRLRSRVPPENLETLGGGLGESTFRTGDGVPGASRRPIGVQSGGIPRGAG
jgi:hypothetical protein